MPIPGGGRKRGAGESVDELREEVAGNGAKKEAKMELEREEEEKPETSGGIGEEQHILSSKAEKLSKPFNSHRPGSFCPAWLGTHRHLQAAIAAIDDRLLFLRICEELEARGIVYEQICVEPLVGGHMLKLTDVSSVVTRHGVECGDFFKNLLRCNIRLNLPEGSSQLECTFTNPPLVPDFERSEEEVETDKQKPHTWVLTIGSQRPREMPSQGQVIAQSIEDRMLTYCHIYGPVRRFAPAYTAHYRHFCSVRTFTYHKLVLAYGDQRELLLVLSWRWQHWHSGNAGGGGRLNGKYALCFGQAPRREQQGGDGQRKRRWNPHVLVSQLLVERFNRDHDLTWLVHYLVSTHRSLAIIHQFVRTQMHSTKVAAQILGAEAAFPAELMAYLVPLDEQIIRLSYGPYISMEFMLLQDNQVAVRDCSSTSLGGGIGLADFWRAFQQQPQGSDEEGGEAVEEAGQAVAATQPQQQEMSQATAAVNE